MAPDSPRSLWRRRRFWWPVASLAALAAALTLAVVWSQTSQVVVYNLTGEAVPSLTIMACGQRRTFHDVGDGESVRFALAPAGEPSEIVLSTPGATLWQGEYMEPRGGYHGRIRLLPHGQTECLVTQSWQPAPPANP